VQTQRITGLTYDSCYLCVKNGQLLATGRWFSPGTPVSSTNKTNLLYALQKHFYFMLICVKVLDTLIFIYIHILSYISEILESYLPSIR
jgi:hypothetical protein